MIDLLSSIADTITIIISLVISTISSFVNLFTNMITYVEFLFSSIAFLPEIVIPFATCSLLLYCLLFLLGR